MGDDWCPCYDRNGSNIITGFVPLPIFSSPDAAGPGSDYKDPMYTSSSSPTDASNSNLPDPSSDSIASAKEDTSSSKSSSNPADASNSNLPDPSSDSISSATAFDDIVGS